MGILKDKAKAQSKFLILAKGETAIVQLLGFKMVPSERDPTIELALFELLENGRTKFWKNGSSSVWMAMDAVNRLDWIQISRNKAIKQDGTEDLTKSKYVVEVLPGYVPSTTGTTTSPAGPGAAVPSPENSDVPDSDPFAGKVK